jgi:signal transduction histidine kinase
MIIVSIADNGPGIPQSVQERIFEKAFTTKAVGLGTGLGLAIVLQIVQETHGGQIDCISKVGEGTEFVMKIPGDIE